MCVNVSTAFVLVNNQVCVQYIHACVCVILLRWRMDKCLWQFVITVCLFQSILFTSLLPPLNHPMCVHTYADRRANSCVHAFSYLKLSTGSTLCLSLEDQRRHCACVSARVSLPCLHLYVHLIQYVFHCRLFRMGFAFVLQLGYKFK